MINIPLSEIEQKINEFPNDREVILVCNNGIRSSMAVKFLEQRGFNNLRFIEGGIVKWIQNNLKNQYLPDWYFNVKLVNLF